MIAAGNNSQASVTWIEHQTLEHIKGALRVTVDWHAPSVSQSRKKSSIRFTLQSFCRHLQRLMRIEEEGGYMTYVLEDKPYLEDRVRRLAAQHEQFRERVEQLTPRLDSILDWQEEEFEAACDEIRALLNDVDRHDQEEVRLIQETVTLDEGGEG